MNGNFTYHNPTRPAVEREAVLREPGRLLALRLRRWLGLCHGVAAGPRRREVVLGRLCRHARILRVWHGSRRRTDFRDCREHSAWRYADRPVAAPASRRHGDSLRIPQNTERNRNKIPNRSAIKHRTGVLQNTEWKCHKMPNG